MRFAGEHAAGDNGVRADGDYGVLCGSGVQHLRGIRLRADQADVVFADEREDRIQPVPGLGRLGGEGIGMSRGDYARLCTE